MNPIVIFPESLFARLANHLFPGDEDEHGAVLAASVVRSPRGHRLLVQEVFLAADGKDYVAGQYGYRALQPQFIYEKLHYCREGDMAYLAVHNHGGMDYVSFSHTDLESHKRGYPALLNLSRGLPVGALVFAKNAAAGELWWSKSSQQALAEVRVIGPSLKRQYPQPRRAKTPARQEFNRQALFFGDAGQELLQEARIGLIGGGGAGSIENELAAYLGVGELICVDPDRLEVSNRSRVVGSTAKDCAPGKPGELKVKIAERVARQANADINFQGIADSVAYSDVADTLRDCDFLLLAADSMQARLIFNCLVHQYLIPGIQVGAKVVTSKSGEVTSAFSVVRWVTPDKGCLMCNGLIDPAQLALEAKDESARKQQDYGTGQPNPSVITMNAVAAAHAVNDFMFSFLNLARGDAETAYRRYDHLARRLYLDEPRKDEACTECGHGDGSRFAMGDRVSLPVLIRSPAKVT